MTKKSFGLWLALWVVASAFLSTTDFRSSSNDSKFYSRLVGQLADKPVGQWVAPKWGENFYGQPPDKYIHDHLSGNLIPGVLLAKAGVPSQHALNIVQMLFNIFSLILLVKIASFFVEKKVAVHLLWILQLIPIAFTYKIRANHEQGMILWMLVAIYGALLLVKTGRGLWLWALGVAGALLVKGAPVILLPVMGVLVAFFAAEKIEGRPKKALWLASTAVFTIFIVGFVYEFFYRQATGTEFWGEYWRVQIEERSLKATSDKPLLLQKLSNFWYYLNRSIFYTAPWSLVALFIFSKRKHWQRLPSLREVFRLETSQKQKLYVVLFLLAILQIFAFSVSDRRGSRYIFPVFYLFGSGFSIYILYGVEGFKNLAEKVEEKLGAANFAAILWFVTFNVHIMGFLLKN